MNWETWLELSFELDFIPSPLLPFKGVIKKISPFSRAKFNGVLLKKENKPYNNYVKSNSI